MGVREDFPDSLLAVKVTLMVHKRKSPLGPPFKKGGGRLAGASFFVENSTLMEKPTLVRDGGCSGFHPGYEIVVR